MEHLIYSSKSLGQILRQRRKAKKLTQQEAGNTFNIQASTLSSIEQGAPGTRLETLFRVLAALDLEMVIRPKKKMHEKTKESW